MARSRHLLACHVARIHDRAPSPLHSSTSYLYNKPRRGPWEGRDVVAASESAPFGTSVAPAPEPKEGFGGHVSRNSPRVEVARVADVQMPRWMAPRVPSPSLSPPPSIRDTASSAGATQLPRWGAPRVPSRSPSPRPAHRSICEGTQECSTVARSPSPRPGSDSSCVKGSYAIAQSQSPRSMRSSGGQGAQASPSTPSCRAGVMEGYRGHVPMRGQANWYGANRETEEHRAPFGTDADCTLARRSPPVRRFRRELPDRPLPDRIPWSSSSGGTSSPSRRASVAVPGYSGHVPGKVAENIHGKSVPYANESALAAVERSRSAQQLRRNSVESDAGCSDMRVQRAEPDNVRAAVVGRLSSAADSRSDCSGTSAPRMRAIPGYAGHIPGRQAENVHGATFAAASLRCTGGV
mmetsp:Transcript_48492/g.135512  ORF Transcript_48492/g.135512 Transcript_48492/m.135512 type:complete len:408 (-) Transcript_48492:5-1228(-)